MYYGFFDYKLNITGYSGQDMFGAAHLIFISFAFAIMIFLCIRLRNTRRENIDRYLKVISVVIPVLEAVKIIWESSYDIPINGSFNWTGLLPAYACSLFIYTLPLAAWTKGRLREAALAFLTTLGIFAGLTNFIYLNILNTYPFFSYATFTSLNFHFLMVFTGVFLIVSGYYRPNMRSVLLCEILFVIYALPVSAVNYIGTSVLGGGFDYCFLYSGTSCPVLTAGLCSAITASGTHLRPLYTVICVAGYSIPTLLVMLVARLPGAVKARIAGKRNNETA